MTEPKKLGGFSGWLQDILAPLVKVAVDEAVTDLHADIKADLLEMENKLLGQITQLPSMVASQVEHVALDAEQVAEKVIQGIGGIFDPAKLSQGVNAGLIPVLQGLFDPAKIAQQVIQGIGGGIHIPGFGVEHEATAGTKPQRKVDQIREKLREKDKGETP